jgi:hypothetical protein
MTPCKTGYYCPAGTRGESFAVPCPKGTYRATTMAMDVTDCGICPAGFYCPTEGLTTPLTCLTG